MRYIIVPSPSAIDDDFPAMLPAITVDSAPPRPTGLVNKDGHPIMTAPDPIGFRFGEKD